MDRFLNTQRDEQRKWQQEMEKRMDEQFRVLRRSPPTTDEPSHEIRPERDRPGPPENQRREVTCFNCGRAGHIARNCRRDRRYQNRQTETPEPDASTPPDPVVMNHTTRPRMPDRATNNAVYIRGEINGRPQLCLIDTGSEVSLVPSSTVDGLDLRSCNRFLMAANGSDINVLGEVRVPIKISKGFYIQTSFLVSDQITEPMLGMDWLREHRCRLGFGMGSLFVRRRRISLVKGNGSIWCRRVIVAEEVLVAPKSQRDIPIKTMYGDLTTVAPAWMTEAREIQPGVHLARVVVGDHVDARVRVVNLSEDPVRLPKDRPLGELHPVQVEISERNRGNGDAVDHASPSEKLLADLPEEVPPEIRERLSALLIECGDVFSVTDRDLGKTSVCTHKIETGDARPVRQPLRRQPLPHRVTIDNQLDSMLADEMIEPAVRIARKKDRSLKGYMDYWRVIDRLFLFLLIIMGGLVKCGKVVRLLEVIKSRVFIFPPHGNRSVEQFPRPLVGRVNSSHERVFAEVVLLVISTTEADGTHTGPLPLETPDLCDRRRTMVCDSVACCCLVPLVGPDSDAFSPPSKTLRDHGLPCFDCVIA